MEQLIPQSLLDNFGMHCMTAVVMWLLTIAAVLLDLWDGIYTARSIGQRIHSHKIRVTVAKISEYWRIMLIGFLIDTVALSLPFYNLSYLSMVICIGLIATEAKSMLEHARKRKSKAAELPEVLRMIVDCATEHDAQQAIKHISEYLESTNNSHGTKA